LVYPESLTLEVTTGERQFLVQIDGRDVGQPGDGTTYVLGNRAFGSISDTGFFDAVAEGETTLTIIHGSREVVVPIQVLTAAEGAALIGDAGGVVRATDGTLVQIPPGALPEGVTVSIESLPLPSAENLPPDNVFDAGKVFSLDLGGAELEQPAQLAVPLGDTFDVGDVVYFFKLETMRDSAGELHDIWILTETGKVGDDGLARTTSPPYPGLSAGGQYLAARADNPELLVQVGFNPPAFPGASFGVDFAGGYGINLGGGFLPLFPSISIGITFLAYRDNPRDFPEAEQTRDVQLPPAGSVFTSDLSIPEIDPESLMPVVTDAAVIQIGATPRVQLTGVRFADGEVIFRQGNLEIVAGSVGSDTVADALVPPGMILGLAEILIRHATYGESNAVRLTPTGGLGAVARTGGGATFFQVDVNQNQVAAQFDFGGGTDTVFTPDQTRAYVVAGDKVAVVDAMALRQIDANPATSELDYISIPGNPFIHQIATDPASHFLFVAGGAPTVWVVDIRPNSSSFHQVIRTLNLPDTRRTSSGVAVSPDGTRLLVGTGPGWDSGGIAIFALDPDNEPTSAQPIPEGWGELIEHVQLDGAPNKIVATSDPKRFGFTYRYRVTTMSSYPGSQTQSQKNLMRFGTLTLATGGAEVGRVNTRVEGGHRSPLVEPNYFGPYLSVLTPYDVTFTENLEYAFIAEWQLHLIFGFGGERGGKVGVVKDPFGSNPVYLGATTPIDGAYVDSIAISGDNSRVFASYAGFGEVLVMDTAALAAAGEDLDPSGRETQPLDKVNPNLHITPLTVLGLLQGLSTQPSELPIPDLIVKSVNKPIGFVANNRIQLAEDAEFKYTVRNAGFAQVKADASWTEQVWLGTDPNITATNDENSETWHYLLDLQQRSGPLAAQGEVIHTIALNLEDVEIPSWVSADELNWYVLVDWPEGADVTGMGTVDELNEDGAADNSANRFEFPFLGLDLSPLQINDVGGNLTFNEELFRYEINGAATIGFKPAEDEDFFPLLQLDGQVWFNEENIHGDGTVTALVGDLGQFVLWSGTWDIPVGEIVSNAFMDLTDSLGLADFSLGGLELKFDSLQFYKPTNAPVTQGQVWLQGELKLPEQMGGAAVAINGDNYLKVSTQGVDFTGITISDANAEFELGNFKMKASELRLEYEHSSTDPVVRIGGLFELPQLGATADIRISEGKYFEVKPGIGDNDTEINFVGQLTVDDVEINSDWKLSDIELDIAKEGGDFQVTGSAKVRGVDDVQLSAAVEFANENGAKFARFGLTQDTPFKVHGMILNEFKGEFVSDRNTSDGNEWDPQLEVSGKLELPVDLTGPKADIQGDLDFVIPDEDGKRLRINRNGIELEGTLSLDGAVTLKLFEVVEVQIENPELKFAGNGTNPWAEFRANVIFTNLEESSTGTPRPAEFDFSGSRYIKLSRDGVEVNTKITLPGPFNITDDGSWHVKDLELEINTAENKYEGEAVVKTPDNVFDAKALVTPTLFEFEVSNSDGISVDFLAMTAVVTKLKFASDRDASAGPSWDPELTLKGRLKLPERWAGANGERIEVIIDDDNKIVVNREGISATGLGIKIPEGTIVNALGLLQIKATSATTVSLNFEEGEAKLQGSFVIPSLKDTSVNLEEPNHITVRKPEGSPASFAMKVDVVVPEIELRKGWKLKDIDISVDAPFSGSGNASGGATIVSPEGSTFGIDLEFAEGRVSRVELTSNQSIVFAGVTLAMSEFVFEPDIAPGNDDYWEPRFSFAGSLTAPQSIGGWTVAIPEGEHLIITETSVEVTGAELTIPDVNFSIAGIIEVKAEALKLSYKSAEPDDIFKIQGRVAIPTLYDVQADFADPNFIQISTGGAVEVKGEISINEPIKIVPGVWELRDAKLKIDTTQNLAEASATLLIPTGIELEATVGFLNGELNVVGLTGNDL
ncbi:MAG: hypothetical protein KDA60_10385, partial [Planctomycetales bacterium]|nr:hypothetical protein [Planctomycetales bacterium]